MNTTLEDYTDASFPEPGESSERTETNLVDDRSRQQRLYERADVLEVLYRDHSIQTIAEGVFGGKIGREKLRRRMHDLGLIDPTDSSHPHSHLNALKQAAKERDERDPEPHEKYTKAGATA